jgi:hypothetical protein
MAETKSPLGTLPGTSIFPVGGETPEELGAFERYRNAQKILSESYERRNQLFDPTLLAMAQGFLAPTKSGTFGEAIATTAEKVSAAQADEEKRAREAAAMRFQLAASEAGQYGEMRKARMGANLLSSGQPMSEEDFRRYAQLVGPEAAAKMFEIRKKMEDTKRQEAFRAVIPDLVASKDGKTPTLQDMLAIAANKGLDPQLVFEFFEKAMPKPVSLGAGSTLVQPGMGGGAPTSLMTAPPEPLPIEREARILVDPKAPLETRLAIAGKLFGPMVDPKTIIGPDGQVSTNVLKQLQATFPSLVSGSPGQPPAQAPAQTATPSAVPGAAPSTTPKAAPSATPRAEAPPRPAAEQPAEQAFGPGKVTIPPPSRLAQAPTGFTRGSKEDLEARQAQTKADAERFGPIFKTATEKGDAARQTIPVLETAIRAAQSADFRGGILARPEQLANQFKVALGLADDVDVSRMLKTGVVDQALRQQVLDNLRASFGGNPTEGERNFLMGVNSISDPRELLVYTLMGKMAAAQKDATRYDYLQTYGNYGVAADAAFNRWSSGRGPDSYYPPLTRAREQLMNSAAIAEQWRTAGGYQPDKYDYELIDGKWHRRAKKR